MNLYTIGHSTHSKEEFLQLLKDAEIDVLADVRAFPGSRKFPWFHKNRMTEWLPENGVEYIHISELGGRRRKSKTVDDALNAGWNNQSFHNYADYTLEPDFKDGIKTLSDFAKDKRIAVCCSERHPARCHRLLISNYVALHKGAVFHVLDNHGKTEIEQHEPGRWGAMPELRLDGEVVYPGQANSDA